ncbi:AMP-binding protein [Streptomyces nogalater]
MLTDPRHRPRVLMLGGEPVGPALWRELAAHPEVTAHNFYGPTECTVDALSCRIDGRDRPLVGRPCPGCGRMCSTPGCGRCRPASAASCTWRVRSSPGATPARG